MVVCRIILLTLLLVLAPLTLRASDSLMTVSEFGRKIFVNLGIDTTSGCDKLDSNLAQRFVRDAVNQIGTKISMAKIGSITTSSGTMGYIVDAKLISVQAVMVIKNNFAQPIPVVPFEKFLEAYETEGHVYDSTFEFCAQFGDSLYFYPLPKYAASLTTFYRARGSNVSVYTDTVDLPMELYPAVEFLSTFRGASALGSEFYSNMFYGLLEKEEAFHQLLNRNKAQGELKQ